MVNRNNNMIAKYMPNLKKVSGFEDKSIFKYLWGQALPLGKDIFLHSSPYGIPYDKA